MQDRVFDCGICMRTEPMGMGGRSRAVWLVSVMVFSAFAAADTPKAGTLDEAVERAVEETDTALARVEAECVVAHGEALLKAWKAEASEE